MSTRPSVPQFIEVQAFQRSVDRKFRLVVYFLGGLTFASCFLTYLTIIKPIPAVVYDSGRAVLFEDTTSPLLRLDNVRVEHFAEEFIRGFVGLDSVNLKEDLQKSLNMMTPRFREIVQAEGREVERRRAYQDANVRTAFPEMTFKIADYDPTNQKAKCGVYAWGRMEYEPRFGEKDPSRNKSEWFLTEMLLNREPVTKLTIFGLRVDFAKTLVFGSEAELMTALKKRST